MTTELSQAQRRVLYELVIARAQLKFGDVKPAQRNPLVEAGLIDFEAHPTRKRTKLIIATEKGAMWVANHFTEPVKGTVRINAVWNTLVRKLQAYLAARGDDLGAVLACEGDSSTDDSPSARKTRFCQSPSDPAPMVQRDPISVLRDSYLSLSHGELRRRVRLAQLFDRAGIDSTTFEQTLRELHSEGSVILYPDDERDRLTEEDRAAAVRVSGEPQHLVYWGR